MKINGIFVIGTGTDVGKTYAAGYLVRELRQRGVSAGYYKAALSGALEENGRLIPGDAAFVCELAGLDAAPQELVSYIYKTAVSPALAAEREGNLPDLAVIERDAFALAKKYDYLIVEGSGGIYCPLRRGDTTIELTDVIRRLRLDTVLVADAGLGTLNSIVLTLSYAASHDIVVRGLILNRFERENFLHQDNRESLQALGAPPIVAVIAPDGGFEEVCLDPIFKEPIQ